MSYKCLRLLGILSYTTQTKSVTLLCCLTLIQAPCPFSSCNFIKFVCNFGARCVRVVTPGGAAVVADWLLMVCVGLCPRGPWGSSINDVMLFWGIFYPPPPPPAVMLFDASFNIVGHADPNPPSPPLAWRHLWTTPCPWPCTVSMPLTHPPGQPFITRPNCLRLGVSQGVGGEKGGGGWRVWG